MARRGRGRMQNRRDERKTEAAKRQTARGERTDQQQLAQLDLLFGKGQGAERERARLNKRIQSKVAA